MALIVIFGPPAVGKMTVGYELARRTGLRLFHNHLTIDLVLRFFEWGELAFQRLVGEFRQRIFEEVAGSQLPGLIFTYVWDFNDPNEAQYIERVSKLFRDRGSIVYLVELEAPQAVRLERNATPFRLAEKIPKRNLERSRKNLLDCDEKYVTNSSPEQFAGRSDYLRINNMTMSAGDVAERIIQAFRLPRLEVLSAPAVQIRSQLKPGDIGEIVRLHGEIYAREYGWDETFEAYVAEPLGHFVMNPSDRGRIWIAEQENRIVGCVAIVPEPDSVARLRWFLVDPAARGAGLGRELLRQAIAFATDSGFDRIVLWTVSTLTAAGHLYRSIGFTKTEEKRSHQFGVNLIEERYDLRIR